MNRRQVLILAAVTLTMLFPPTLGRVRASARAQLLAETVERQLGHRTIVKVAGSYGELEAQVLSRSVDIAWAPPSICARAEEKEFAILKVIRQGRSMYRSALICREGAGLSLDSLDGKRAAWVDPLSTGGHLLAIAHLRARGIEPSTTFAAQDFHGSYQGALLTLLRGQADLTSIYVYGTDARDVREALSEHIGASEVQLCAFDFTDESPSDGLIDMGTSESATELIDLLLNDSRSRARGLLLELIDGDALERAEYNDYWNVRQALVAP